MTQPLSDLTVVDLTQTLAGPSCTMHLADLGAEVIKIEPIGGDMMRQWGPPFRDGNGVYFLMYNRNKRSVCLNLRHEEGLKIFYRLADRADVVVESFRPGVKDRLKIDYQTLSRTNPGLVYASLSGYGQTGPYADKGGFDPIAQGMAGIMAVTGTDESGPTKAGAPIGDYLTGVFMALSIMTALHERARSGRGQAVDCSLLESLTALLGMHAAKHLETGERPGPQGNDHPMQAPYGAFNTKDGRLMIAAGNQGMWERLARAVGLEELIGDDRFLTVADRVARRAELAEILEAKLAHKTRAEWQEILDRAGVAAGPINQVDEVFLDPQVIHQQMIRTMTHPVYGAVRTTGFPMNFSRTGPDIRRPAPLQGEHTIEVLTELGCRPDQIDRLIADGAIKAAGRGEDR